MLQCYVSVQFYYHFVNKQNQTKNHKWMSSCNATQRTNTENLIIDNSQASNSEKKAIALISECTSVKDHWLIKTLTVHS